MLDPTDPVARCAEAVARGELHRMDSRSARTTLWLALALALFAAAAHWLPTHAAEHRVADVARTSAEN